jgi:hypothetical protein
LSDPWAAALIGAIGGIVVVYSVFSGKRAALMIPSARSLSWRQRHLGVLSVGIFANGAYGAGWNGVVRDSFVKIRLDGVRGLLYGDFLSSSCKRSTPVWCSSLICHGTCGSKSAT